MKVCIYSWQKCSTMFFLIKEYSKEPRLWWKSKCNSGTKPYMQYALTWKSKTKYILTKFQLWFVVVTTMYTFICLSFCFAFVTFESFSFFFTKLFRYLQSLILQYLIKTGYWIGNSLKHEYHQLFKKDRFIKTTFT